MNWARSLPADARLLTARRCGLLSARLPALRAVLMQQRDFRREQLSYLDELRARDWTSTSGGRQGVDRGEVQALVEAGARRALADIELALARIRTGDYGRCHACDADIPLAVLVAIPQTTLCLSCHQLIGGVDSRFPAG